MPTEIAGVDNEDLASACSCSQAALECCGGSLSFRLCMFCELAVACMVSEPESSLLEKYCQHNVSVLIAGEGWVQAVIKHHFKPICIRALLWRPKPPE
jgi:hypothetical protein